jgi:glutamate/tyrosine decarboxylase-like PLP-dependent enzyme
MEPSADEEHGGELGLQGTRPAEILKLWLGLRQLGLEGIASLLEQALQRRRVLEGLLARQGDLQLQGGRFHLLAFRPGWLDRAASERWSRSTREALLSRDLMLSRPDYQGHHHLKAVLGNPHTRTEHLELLAEVVAQSKSGLAS